MQIESIGSVEVSSEKRNKIIIFLFIHSDRNDPILFYVHTFFSYHPLELEITHDPLSRHTLREYGIYHASPGDDQYRLSGGE